MKKGLFKEGRLEGCKETKCSFCCCDDDLVEEWVVEYAAFHEKMKDYLLSLGIKIKFVNDRVKYTHCSDGKECKFVKYSKDENVDPRPIDCKIYPFIVDWNTIDFDKKIVRLFYWDSDCPLAKENKISQEFRDEIVKIIKRDFSIIFHGMNFQVKFINKVLDHHRFYNFQFKPDS